MALLGEILVRFNSETAGFVSGVGLATAALVAVGAGIEKVTSMAGDFQAGITNLGTAAGENAKNLGMVGDGIKKVAVDTGTSTKDLIDAMFMIESSGAHGAIGINELSIAARGAKTDNAELMVVSKALTGVLAGWPATTNGAAGAMNELIVAASEGKMHLQDLSKAMGNVIPIASAAGVSFADIGAAVAMMTNKNMTAQRASQAVAFALRDLSAPSGIAQKAMDSVGLSAQDLKDTLSTKGLGATLQQITDAVGNTFPAGSIEATTALKNIMGGAAGLNVILALGGKNLSTYEQGVKKIADAAKNGGQAVEGWSTVQNNFNTKVDRAKASLEVLGITLGTELLPILGRLVDQVAPLVTRFLDWENKTHTVQNALKSLVDGITNIISGVSGFVNLLNHNSTAMDLFKSVLTAIAVVVAPLVVMALASMAVAAWAAMAPMLPFIALIGVIALAIFGLIQLIRNWGAIMDWLTGKTKQSQLEQQELNQKNALKAIQTQEEQKRGVLANMEDERTQLIAKIKSMADGADKTREQIRLSALNAQINTTKGDLKELDSEKAQHLKTLKDLQAQDPQIREQTKIKAIQTQIAEKDGILKGLEDEKKQLLEKLMTERDGAAKTRDLMRLDAINKQIDTTTGSVAILNDEYTKRMALLNKLKTDDLEARKGWYDRANDATTVWVNEQTRRFDAMVSGWSQGLDKWVNDGLTHLGQMVSGWSQGLDQWSNEQMSKLGEMIGGWMSGLGTWISNTLAIIGSLPGRAGAALSGLPGAIMGVLQQAAAEAFSGGMNIVQGVANGIYNSIGSAVAAAQSLASQVAAFLPHSPAKEGPLKDLNAFGPALVQGFASGIDSSHPLIKASMEHLLTPVGSAIMPTLVTGQGTSTQGQSTAPTTQTIIIQMDGRDVAKALGPHLTNEIRLVAQVRR